MKNEASVTPLGVIALSSFLSNVSKKFSRSLIKVLVCHYSFYVHKMCFWILFLLQHPFSFHYILSQSLGARITCIYYNGLNGHPSVNAMSSQARPSPVPGVGLSILSKSCGTFSDWSQLVQAPHSPLQRPTDSSNAVTRESSRQPLEPCLADFLKNC